MSPVLLWQLRALLFLGQYDARVTSSEIASKRPIQPLSASHALNPHYDGDDLVAQRFSLLEVY
jgi:hypothetical protein